MRVGVVMGLVGLGACGSAPEMVMEGGAATAARARNVVVVMTDDQGWGDLGRHGNPVLETPRLDALAEESARLEHFYVHPVCTPTRAALFTGRMPQRSTAIDTYRGRAMLAPEEVTVAEVMRDAGWATGLFGKWHLGDCAPMRPMDQGFERSLVHRGGGIGQPSDPIGAEAKYTGPVLMNQGIEEEFEGYCTEVYFREAMRWMEERQEAGEPFLCVLTPNAPHTPLGDVPLELLEKYRAMDLGLEAFAAEPGHKSDFQDEEKLARLYAMIEDIDTNMGRLLDFLEEQGLAEDTLLLFLCDNGPQGRRFNAGLKGAKGSVDEGGVRSPLFARWPAGLPARGESRGYAAHVDLFPTILEATGVALPAEVRLDGRSALGLLRGEPQAIRESRERPLVLQWHRGDFPLENHHLMVRLGDEKLVNRTSPWDELEEPPTWMPELYDLAADPFEQHDLAAERPERVATLEAAYREWFLDAVGEAPEHIRRDGGVAYYRRLQYLPPPIRLGGEGAERVVLTKQDWRPSDSNGWGKNGTWRVAFTDLSPWRVRVILPEGVTPSSVELGINSGVWTYVTHEGTPVEGSREVLIEDVDGIWLVDQPASVSVTLKGLEGGDRGPHQVIFER
jgi:arylsulfatase A-like enzyme